MACSDYSIINTTSGIPWSFKNDNGVSSENFTFLPEENAYTYLMYIKRTRIL